MNDNDESQDTNHAPLDFFEEEPGTCGAVPQYEQAVGDSTENTGTDVQELDETEVEEARVKAETSKEADHHDKTDKLVIIDDPYIPGQCTTRVTLVISPDDGHEHGPLVFITASTHEDLPGALLICRLNELALPSQILDAITSAHKTLSQRGEEKRAALHLAAKKKREVDEKEEQRKQKKQIQAKKEAEKKKSEEKRAQEPQITDMFAALT